MRVYLSYDESDRKFAAELRNRLIVVGFEVWNPQTELAPGSNWLKETGRALERANAIVFVLSKRAVRSSSIQKEIDHALTNRRFANRVFPVVIDDDVEVPWILRELGLIKAGGSAETVANRISRSLRKPAIDQAAHRRRLLARRRAAKNALKTTSSASKTTPNARVKT